MSSNISKTSKMKVPDSDADKHRWCAGVSGFSGVSGTCASPALLNPDPWSQFSLNNPTDHPHCLLT